MYIYIYSHNSWAQRCSWSNHLAHCEYSDLVDPMCLPQYKWNFELNVRIEQKGSYKERGRGRNRGNNFIPTSLVRVKVTVWVFPPSWSFLHQPWQLRWTVHIRRMSTTPLVQQWTVKVHGWQGGYINTEKWRAHTFVDTVSTLSLSLTYVLSAYPGFGCWLHLSQTVCRSESRLLGKWKLSISIPFV